MRITCHFKGSIFNQKTPVVLSLSPGSTIKEALSQLTALKPSLSSLLLKDEELRNDILLIVEQIDISSMNKMSYPLEDGQNLYFLPLAHGG
jgi:molybdopterin converting factor small subunit